MELAGQTVRGLLEERHDRPWPRRGGIGSTAARAN